MKINLVEEWKLYETMWDTPKQEDSHLIESENQFRSEYQRLMSTPEGREKFKAMSYEEKLKLYKEDSAADPVQQVLNQTQDIEFEFDGFSRERYEDKWDYNTGHYTKDWTDKYNSFTYKQDATTVFEDLINEMIPKYIDTVKQDSIVQECKRLYDAWQSSTKETNGETRDEFELFVAQNLEEIAIVFNSYLVEKYTEAAEEWAETNKEPTDPRDYWEDLSIKKQPLDETVKVMSNPDNLYHWTNPTPFTKIFTENCLRADVNMKCVCFTTDKDYMLYEYPCGLKLSREKLLKAGYELEEADEFDWDPDGIGESEERIYKNIDNITDYVTAVGINWEHISVVQSKEGDRIADSTYDEYGDELENYDLFLSNFYKLLDSLKAKGIKVVEKGKPQVDEYYLDDNGKLKYGKMPA